MKTLVISDLKLMRSLIDSILSKFGCRQFSLEHIPAEISAFLKKETVDLVIVHEQDHVKDTLSVLGAVFSADHILSDGLKCLLIRKHNTFHSEELAAYKDFVIQGKLTLLLPDHLENSLTCYFEQHLRRALPTYLESRIDKKDLPILLVDDSPIIRTHLLKALTKKGYTVLEAEDGQKGWDVFDAFSPAIVVTDICMPNMSGIELCQKIKTKNAYTEVIVMSSLSHEKTTDMAFQAGADDFLIKPFELNRMLSKIEKIIDSIMEKCKYRILIVDDDPFIKENLRREFKKNNMEVLMAANGMEGFSVAMLENPAIIITDIEMPVMGGYDFLTAIKSVRQLEQTTVIMMSGKFAKGKVKMSTNHAPIQFFSKPFDMERMVMFTEQLIVNKSLQSSQEYDLLISSIMALVTALEARDIYTKGHSERVTAYSLRIGNRMGLSGKQLKILELAASLHDLGKIGIRDDILLKPETLTNQEFETIKEHSFMGSKILSTIESLSYISTIILHHHERYDGNGYPKGISGQDIPIESRIIAVADTFDAVTYSRPYRKTPLEKCEAETLLESLVGNQLCPDCTRAFLLELESEDFLASEDPIFQSPVMSES